MAKINITQYQLIEYHKQNVELQNKKHVLELYLRRKINDFYQNNGLRLKSTLAKADELLAEYFELEGNNVKMEVRRVPIEMPEYVPEKLSWWDKNIKGKKQAPVPEQKYSEENHPVMKEGKLIEDYHKAMKEFNDNVITIEI